MQQWLEEKRQPPRADRAFLAAGPGQRHQRGSGPHGRESRLSGLPAGFSFAIRTSITWACPPCRWRACIPPMPGAPWATSRFFAHAGAAADRLQDGKVRALSTAGGELTADFYISAVPFERIAAIAPELAATRSGRSSSIPPSPASTCGSTVPITDLPHAHSARPHHSVDVQQEPGPLYPAGGQRVAQLGGDAARRRDRAGAAGTGRIFPGGQRRRSSKNRTWSKKSARRFPPSPAWKRTAR